MKRQFDLSPFSGEVGIFADLLGLDEIRKDVFRSRYTQPNSYSGIFGGQLLAHALAAADRTAPERAVHSLHAYFLRSGEADKPLDYAVERIRDGRRFSSRRVLATQDDTLLFTMDCSYRTPMEGVEHQVAAQCGLEPDGALDLKALNFGGPDGLTSVVSWAGSFPIEGRVPSTKGFSERSNEPRRHYWLRAPTAATFDDEGAHRQILAFMSDWLFSGVPLAMHTNALPGPHIFVASLDHSIWFHRPVRCDDWLLFQTESPSANGAVNFSRGLIYDRQGRLVASIAQEALQNVL